MSHVVVTLDVDWAPDFVVDDVADLLRSKDVRATWFATHRSPAIERLLDDPGFEVGVHPNFFPGSDHGAHPSEVLEHLSDLFPNAVSFRTHGLVESGPLLRRVMEETSLEVDCNTFLPDLTELRPTRIWMAGDSLIRVPFVWADSHELDRPKSDWRIEEVLGASGLRVLLFHPIHVHLNLADRRTYRRIADSPGGVAAMTPGVCASLVRDGPGPRSCLRTVIDHLANQGGGRTVRDVATHWAAEEAP